MLKMIIKLLKVLNSEANPGQISLAFSFSMIVGFTPTGSLHNLMVLFLVLVLRVNLSAFILGFLFFTGFSYALDPLFHRVGLAILTAEGLQGLWVAFYNSSLGQIEGFYNSIVMGSLLFSIILFFPLYFIANMLIVKYRENVLAYVRKLRFVEIFKGRKFYKLYHSVSDMGATS